MFDCTFCTVTRVLLDYVCMTPCILSSDISEKLFFSYFSDHVTLMFFRIKSPLVKKKK